MSAWLAKPATLRMFSAVIRSSSAGSVGVTCSGGKPSIRWTSKSPTAIARSSLAEPSGVVTVLAGRRSVAIEADDEPAVRRGGGQHLSVDIDNRARRGAADRVAALDELARQGQARRGRAGGSGEGGKGQRGDNRAAA